MLLPLMIAVPPTTLLRPVMVRVSLRPTALVTRTTHTIEKNLLLGGLLVVGGQEAGTRRALGDVHKLDLQTLRWYRLSPSDPPFAGLYGHATFVYGDRLFVTGGCLARRGSRTEQEEAPSNETHALDLARLEWSPFEAMAGAEAYYESLGRTWERAAYIKARPAAGDVALGQALITQLQPWIYGRYLIRADITGLSALKRRFERQANPPGIARPLGQTPATPTAPGAPFYAR